MDAIIRADDATKISHTGIMHLGLGFQASKTLLSAVELDLFTELAVSPLDAEDLRRRLGLHERGARDFFDALVALGMLERQDGVYSNTPATDLYLDRNKPSFIGEMLQWANARLYPAWGTLTEALVMGGPRNGYTDEKDLFDTLYSDPDTMAGFARAMTGFSIPVARALADRFPWAACRTFIDIGAAEGGATVEIARAHPHLTGRGFDLPAMRPVFETYVERHSLADRLGFHAGDFLAEPLPSADVLVMGQILHDWNIEVKRELLAKAYGALPRGGSLIVYDQMIDDDRRSNAAGLLMSLNMLVRTRGGFDYTIGECVNWMGDAGFREVHFSHLDGCISMIAAVK